MNKRIRLNGGHAALSVNGFSYLPDETGAFEVPEDLAPELIRVHGGQYDPGVEQLEELIKIADANVASTKNLLEMQTTQAKEARENLEKYKAHMAELAAVAKKKEESPTVVAAQISNQQQQKNNQNQNNNRR